MALNLTPKQYPAPLVTLVKSLTAEELQTKLFESFNETSSLAAMKMGEVLAAMRQTSEGYLEMLEYGQACCGYCIGDGIFQVHNPIDCPRMSRRTNGQFKGMKAGITFPLNKVCCFHCGVISVGHDILHADYSDGLCAHLNFTMALVFHAYMKHGNTLLQNVHSHPNQAEGLLHDPRSFGVWLGKANNTREKTNFFSSLWWYYRRHINPLQS